MLFNFAPRKFKNLGTDTFIVSRLTKFFLVISRCKCNKGVRSRQEYIKMSSIANFCFDVNGSEILESHFEIFLMCTQSNPYLFKEAEPK